MANKAPKNMRQLRDDLLTVYNGLREGTVPTSEAKSLTNVAGRVIASCKVEMDYAKLRGETPSIGFIEEAK